MAKYNQGNDVTGIQQPTTDESINKVTQTNEFENVNFTWQEEGTQARNTAMENHIAGIPLVSPTITIPKEKPDLSQPEITSGFTTRDQIMSKLNLMDENYNYTDTYTNYINKGGAPLPGYEYAHEELLNQERYDTIFQKVEDGSLSYDTALMEAYGKDIMATEFGMDVTSVAYWQNKFQSNDFSNPFTNRYLMDKVKQRADQYHQARLAGDYANKKASDTQLQTLVGDDLSYKKIRELFPDMSSLKEDIEEKDFMKALHTGQIHTELRMTTDSKGNTYYLHTDGELYILDGQKGIENHGTLKQDADGNIIGIDLNNSEVASFGRSTWTGFSSVFTSIGELTAVVGQSATSLVTLGMLDGDFGWDGADEFVGWANSFDAFLNDDAAWLVDTGYVDMDSSKMSGQDWANLVGSMAGTIAGTLLLGNIMGRVSEGAKAGTGLIGWGDDLVKAGHTASGKTIKGFGTALKWQTGNIGTQTGAVTSAQIWGRRAGAAAVANTKNMANDYRKLTLQSKLYEDGASEGEILKRTFFTSVLNTVIDTTISGGLDDNQVQAYKSLFTSGKREAMGKILNSVPDGAVKTFLNSRGFTIAANSFMDFAGNMMTGSFAMNNQLENDGTLKEFKAVNFDSGLLARSALNTLWYSTRGQIKEWNLGLETIGESHTRFMNKIDAEIAKHKGDVDSTMVLTQFKADYIKAISESKQDLYEGKIIEAMDKVVKKMGDEIPNTLKTSVEEVVSAKARNYYEQLYKQGLETYNKRIEKLNNNLAPDKEDGKTFFKLITRPFHGIGKAGKKVGGFLSGDTAANTAANKEKDDQLKFMVDIEAMRSLLFPEDSIKAIDKAEEIVKNNFKEKSPLRTVTGSDLFQSSKKGDQKLFETLKEEDANAATNHYFILPNHLSKGKLHDANDAALDIMESLGYITKVGDTDYVYKVQPYFDQMDFVNSAMAIKLIHNSTLALATEVDLETKTTIMKDLAKGLMDDAKVSASDRSAVLSSILVKLSKTGTAKSKGNTEGAVDTGKALSQTEAQKIFLELQKDGTIIKIDLKNNKDTEAVDAWKYLATGGDILLKIQKDKGKLIDLTDPIVQKWIKEAKDEGTITEEQYKQLMQIQKDNPDFFQVGNQLNNKQKYIERTITDAFLKMAPEIKGLSEKGLREAMKLYFAEMGLDEDFTDGRKARFKYEKEYAEVLRLAKQYDEITKSTKTITLGEDNIVYIDLSRFRGKASNELIKDLDAFDASIIKRLENSKEFRKYESRMFKELQSLNKYSTKSGSIITFDLNSDIDKLKQFMSDFNYTIRGTSPDKIKQELNTIDGVRNFLGDTIVLDIPRCENIDELKVALKNGRLRAGELDINFRAYVDKDIRGNALADVDIEKAILDTVEVKNLDPRLKIALKSAPLIQLFPFTPAEDGKYSFTQPMASALLGGTLSLEKQSGKAARQTAKQLEQIFVRSTGSSRPIDTNLENYFILDLLATTLSNNSHWSIPLADSEIKALKEKGIVNYRRGKQTVIPDKNNIWIIEGKTLRLNKDINIESLREYIVSDDFNFFRMIPLVLTNNLNSNHGIIDIESTFSTEGFNKAPSGTPRDTLLEILSTRLPWDNGDNTRMLNFFKGVIDHNEDLDYNPIKGAGYTSPKATQDYETFNDWYKASETSTNPYDIITKRYIDTYNEMVHGQPGAKKFNNETLLVRECAPILLRATDFKATNELVEDVVRYFSEGKPKQYQAAGSTPEISTPQFYGGRAVNDGEILVSPTSLRGAFGKNIEIQEGLDLIDLDTVQKALDIIKDIKTNAENEYRTSFYSDYIIRTFQEDNATKLLKGMAGSDGYATLEDADELAYLLAENYKQYADGQDTSLIFNKQMEAVAKYIWGKDYLKQVQKIFDASERQHKLSYSKKAILTKGPIKQDGASIQIDGNSGYGKPFIETEEGELLKPDSDNFNNMEKYLSNSIENKLNNPRNKYEKLMESTSELIDHELSDSITKRIGEDRLLYTSAPYASENQVVSFRHNSFGFMQTTLNTYTKLLENYKWESINDQTKKNLMKLATTITNLNVGVDYAGETAKYLVVGKNGELVENGEDLLDKYASANLKDLLYNIHRSKDKLKNHIIISTNHQDISNTAGIQMSYKEINTDDDYNNLVTDLYHNFILSNSYLFAKENKSIEEQIATTNQLLGGNISREVAQAILDRIPSSNLSSILRDRKEYDVFKERTGVSKLSKLELMAAIKSTNNIEMSSMTRQAVEDSIERPNEVHANNSDGLSKLRNLSYLVGDPEYYSSEKREALEEVMDAMTNKVSEEDNKLVHTILKTIANSSSPEMIDLVTRKRSLSTMKDEVDSGKVAGAFVINKDNEKVQTMDSEPLKNLVTSLMKNDTTIKTDTDIAIGFDSETGIGIGYNAADRSDAVFSIGLVIYTKGEHGWEEKPMRIYVDYETATYSRDMWIKDNIDFKHQFYKDNIGYQDEVDMYKNIDKHVNNETIFYMKPAEIKELFNKTITNKTAIVGYNSSNADLMWFKNCGLIDDTIIGRSTHIDVKTLGDTSLARESKISGKKDVRAEKYGISSYDAHGAYTDAKATMELLFRTAATAYNISAIRNKAYEDVKQSCIDAGFKVDDDTFNSALRQVDAIIKDNDTTKLNDYFDKNVTINPETVTAATELFEYAINKRMANMELAIRDEEVRNNYYTKKAIDALDTNAYRNVEKLWSLANAKGVDKEAVVTAFSKELYLSGECTMNSLLEVLGDETRMDNILGRLGLTYEEYSQAEGTKMFKGLPKNDPDLSNVEFEKEEMLKDTRELYGNVKSIIQSLNITDEITNQDIANELLKFYEFREGMTEDEMFKENVHTIDTKIGKMYEDYLKGNYGTADAIISTRRNGIYDLIDALPVGKTIHDAVSNKNIITDSSMIVISPEHFRHLTGMSLKDYKKEYGVTEIYSQLLIHPADANNKILPRRIIVNSKADGKLMQVPETVIETLGARDFDGDHLILLAPDMVTQDVLRIYTNNMYRAHNVQESVLSALRSTGVYYDDYEQYNYIINTLGKDRDILRVCRQADEALSRGEHPDTAKYNKKQSLTQRFEQLLENKNIKNVDIEKIKSELWVVEKDLYEVDRSTTPLRYINNPAVYLDKDGTGRSYSGRKRAEAEAKQLVSKYQYSFIDQVTGMQEKGFITKLKNKKISNPWTDILASGIYGSKTVARYFDNYSFENDKGQKQIEAIEKALRDGFSYIDAKADIGRKINMSVNSIINNLKEGKNGLAFSDFNDILRAVESYERQTMSTSELMDALTSEAIVERYEKLSQDLQDTKRKVELCNELTRNERFYNADSYYGDVVNYTINEQISSMTRNGEGIFDQNIFKQITPVKGFVITRFGNDAENELATAIANDEEKINIDEFNALVKEVNKLQAQVSKDWFNMPENPTAKDFKILREKKLSHDPILAQIAELKSKYPSYKKQLDAYYKEVKRLDTENIELSYEPVQLPIGIGEDTVLYNNRAANEQVGYTRAVYTISEKDNINKDIEAKKVYKKGTKISDNIKLPEDFYVVSVTNKHITGIQVNKLDNGFKITTDLGGKGVLNSQYSTDEDITFLLNKPKQNKVAAGYSQKLSTKERAIVLRDESGGYIIAYGYDVDNLKPVVTENTHGWNSERDRNIDLLHYVMDLNSLSGILDMGAKYSKENGLETNPEGYADIVNSVYHQYQDSQVKNFIGTFNKIKVLYILNRLSDEELISAFKSKKSANELRHLLLNNMETATDAYTSLAYTLGVKFKDKIDQDNHIAQRLFSEDFYKAIGSYYRSASGKVDPTKATSKSDIPGQVSLKGDGTSTLKMYLGKLQSLSSDAFNADKSMENLEDYYLSPFDFYRILFGSSRFINTYKINELMKARKLPWGTFIADTANPNNGYRHWSTDHTRHLTEERKLLAPYGSTKTGVVANKQELVGVSPRIVDLQDPTIKEGIAGSPSSIDGRIVKLLTDDNIDIKYASTNKAKVANMLYQLQNLRDEASVSNKTDDLYKSKRAYRIYDSHLSVMYDESGNPYIELSKHIPLTGNLKKLKNQVKGSVYNYATYNALHDQNKDSLDYDSINKTVNRKKYKSMSDKSIEKSLDDLYSAIKVDLYDEETGEVKQDFDVRDYRKDPEKIAPAKVLSSGEKFVGDDAEIRPSVWGRQGLAEDTKMGVELTTALKNYHAGATYFQQDALRVLENFKAEATSRMSEEEIKEYAVCNAILTQHKSTKDITTTEKHLRYHKFESLEQVEEKLNMYTRMYPEVAIAFNRWLDHLNKLNEVVAKETGEPIQKVLFAEIAPYKSTSKEINNIKASAAIKNVLGLQKYDPTADINKGAASLEFDIWNSSKAIIAELSKMHAANAIKQSLHNTGSLNNKPLLDKVGALIDTAMESASTYKVYSDKNTDAIERSVIDAIYDLTGVKADLNDKDYPAVRYGQMYKTIDTRLDILISKFNETYNRDDLRTYSDFERFSTNPDATFEQKEDAKTIANFFYAKLICGQGLIQSSSKFASDLGSYIESMKNDGYCLANAYGQKYVKGGIVNPFATGAMSNLVENMEIQYNSNSDVMWNQFVLEKIIRGEVFLMREDIANHLESHAYTTKMPSLTTKTLKEISKWSSAFQMALPSKILNRLISFTGFDYSMGIMYDPAVIKYIGPARRELLAAFQSKGTQLSDRMKEYMIREGQPIGLTGKDPVTFSEELNGPEAIMRVLNTMTDPLEFQNHLGRYAIYLAALDGFENGKPNYGPLYAQKEAVDALEKPEDKAMFVMDYLLGSPGGFPELAKKTSGWMLYATFPMNFARTMGAYGMSLGRLFREGFNSENNQYWAKTVAVPSMGLAAITGMSMLITSLICDLFGIEEDEKEKLVKDLSTIDPVGTIIGGTPTKSGSSMNPLDTVNSMVIEPFTNKYNDNLFKKVFGVVNTNVLSHLNPAIKAPLEVVTGYDMFGSSLMNTKHNYTNIENGIRKTMGFVIGSSTANAIVDQYKMDKYVEDRGFMDSLIKGASRGIANSLGNQKTYKKDTTNYYNNIYAINNFNAKVGTYYDTDVEDYADVEEMERIRNYRSKYGSYNSDDYTRISRLLKKMIQAKEEPITVYSMIIEEYNNGVDERTLRSVLNNNSLARKLNRIDKEAYLNTLTNKEYKDLVRALTYEKETYPLLVELFPDGSDSTYLNAKYKKPYYRSGGSGGSNYIPSPRYYKPKLNNYYPNSYSNKYKSYKPYANIDRVSVKVSPEMAVWKNDYNAIDDLEKREWYLDNPFYNNLSDYEKRQKGGN